MLIIPSHMQCVAITEDRRPQFCDYIAKRTFDLIRTDGKSTQRVKHENIVTKLHESFHGPNSIANPRNRSLSLRQLFEKVNIITTKQKIRTTQNAF